MTLESWRGGAFYLKQVNQSIAPKPGHPAPRSPHHLSPALSPPASLTSGNRSSQCPAEGSRSPAPGAPLALSCPQFSPHRRTVSMGWDPGQWRGARAPKGATQTPLLASTEWVRGSQAPWFTQLLCPPRTIIELGRTRGWSSPEEATAIERKAFIWVAFCPQMGTG